MPIDPLPPLRPAQPTTLVPGRLCQLLDQGAPAVCSTCPRLHSSFPCSSTQTPRMAAHAAAVFQALTDGQSVADEIQAASDSELRRAILDLSKRPQEQ